jgi:hypothetical protein
MVPLETVQVEQKQTVGDGLAGTAASCVGGQTCSAGPHRKPADRDVQIRPPASNHRNC